MPDRLALPDDRREACRACGSEKREELTQCWDCGADICSECCVMANDVVWADVEVPLCRKHALKRLNQALTDLLPDKCTCKYPAWSRYGQQFPLEAA